jgi:hypothetical protein
MVRRQYIGEWRARRSPYAARSVSPFWIYTQIAIVLFVLAGIVIGVVKLV